HDERSVEELMAVCGERPTRVADTTRSRAALWSLRERHPEIAGWTGPPIKLDVAVPDHHWVSLVEHLPAAVAHVDPDATVVLFGHIADGNVHVNVVPGHPTASHPA